MINHLIIGDSTEQFKGNSSATNVSNSINWDAMSGCFNPSSLRFGTYQPVPTFYSVIFERIYCYALQL